jgi:membrane fusion protein (multidrug efflux system)
MSTPDSEPASEAGSPARRRGLIALAAVVLLAGAAWAFYWHGHARWRISTDNAYVGGNIVQLTAEIPGTVRAIHARETETVAVGQTLLELDPSDARIAMDAAVSDLANTVRQVRGTFVQIERLRAQVAVRDVELQRARADLSRRRSVANGGAISAEEFAHAQESVKGLEAALRAAREDLNVALAQTEGTTPEQHPLVLRAAARVRDAGLTLQRTTIASPVNGVVGRKGVQIGQRIAPGMPLMGIVPLDDIWVDANFKEVQLARMHIGQPAEVESDLYGRKLTFSGHVVGISPGTGAAFALLPPQNASGNWIKIVQRVPVRIALDPGQVREHPLRIGLSMRVTVDLHDESGPVLTQPQPAKIATISPRAAVDPSVEALIERIIAANSGRPAKKG